MSQFGNVPTGVLVDAVEKHVAKMDEDDLASLLLGGIVTMALPARTALVASMFEAFRDRGEASEDAAEGANASVESLEAGNEEALRALIGYARENPGLLKETMPLFAEHHAAQLHALPRALLDGIGERL